MRVVCVCEITSFLSVQIIQVIRPINGHESHPGHIFQWPLCAVLCLNIISYGMHVSCHEKFFFHAYIIILPQNTRTTLMYPHTRGNKIAMHIFTILII